MLWPAIAKVWMMAPWGRKEKAEGGLGVEDGEWGDMVAG